MWLWHCDSRKGAHSSWSLTLSTCQPVRGRSREGPSTRRPTNPLQLLPPLTTVAGDEWGSVLGVIRHGQENGEWWNMNWDLIVCLYILFLRVGKCYWGACTNISPQTRTIQCTLWLMLTKYLQYDRYYLKAIEYINSFHLPSHCVKWRTITDERVEVQKGDVICTVHLASRGAWFKLDV